MTGNRLSRPACRSDCEVLIVGAGPTGLVLSIVMLHAGEDPVHDISAMNDHRADRPGGRSFLSWPLRLRSAYHDEVSSQDEGWQRPDYPQWSGEPAEAPDILEQGRDRPPTRWRLAVRWRRPPTVAISLGVAGLLAGLAAGYAAGTLHAEKAPVSSARSGATASPTTISPISIGRASSQFQLLCSATGMPRQPDRTFWSVSTSTAHGTVTVIFPSGGLVLTCRQ